MNHDTILLVEDNEDDAFFMQRALRDAGVDNPVIHLEDGREAIDYLGGTGKYTDRSAFPLPGIVFLDLKLPFKTGLQVLEWVRKDPGLSSLVVIVLTSSGEAIDVTQAYRLGTNSYVVKPPTPPQLLELATAFKHWWLKINRLDTRVPL